MARGAPVWSADRLGRRVGSGDDPLVHGHIGYLSPGFHDDVRNPAFFLRLFQQKEVGTAGILPGHHDCGSRQRSPGTVAAYCCAAAYIFLRGPLDMVEKYFPLAVLVSVVALAAFLVDLFDLE